MSHVCAWVRHSGESDIHTFGDFTVHIDDCWVKNNTPFNDRGLAKLLRERHLDTSRIAEDTGRKMKGFVSSMRHHDL